MMLQKKINVANSSKLEQVLHMNGGDKENSYANNSFLQKKVLLRAKPILQESVAKLCTEVFSECITFAEMGCSSGPNTFLPLWEIIETIDETFYRLNKKNPMMQVFLNDLPENDFNSIFKSLPSFQKKLQEERGSFRPCFVGAMPGNFYGRLFPPHSLHLVHSSCSLHWLSEVPKVSSNKGQICIAKTSPPEVHEAYLVQFEKDMTSFLKARSEEVVARGRMVLCFYGRVDDDYSYYTQTCSIWELFSIVLTDMISEGIIEESKLDSFNLPIYLASAEEVKNVIRKEGSFKINKMETFKTGWDGTIEEGKKELMDNYTKGKFISNCFRAFLEPILEVHFGSTVVDGIFQRFSVKLGDNQEIAEPGYVLASVTRK